MAVNENIYGDKNLWHNAFFQQSTLTNKNKLPYFDVNRTTLLDGTRANKLSFSEPIDKSISYCGLGKESALSHIAYTNFVNGNVEITDIQDRTVTNFAFFEKNNTVQFISNSSAFYYDNINWIKWADDYAELNNYQRLLSPLTLVNPHNIVLAINVSAYDSNMSNHITTSLYNYIQYNTSSHPNIDRVTIQPFYGDISLTSQRDIYGGQGNVTYRIPFQLGILDEYQMPSKNVNFYSYGIADFPVFGNVQNLPYTYNNTNVFGMVLHTENSLPHIKIVRGSNDISYVYTEYYLEFEQDIMKTVACFGLYFSPIVSTAREGSLTDNNMYIGILDENGIGHGEYLRGSNTVNAPQNNYTDMSNSGYDYKKHDDNTKYQNDTQFNLNLSLGAFTKFYQLTENQVNELCTALYTAVNAQPTGTPIEEYNMKCFLTNNPIDCIISLKKFPLNHFPSVAGTIDDVYLGAVDSGIDAPRILSTTWVYYFDFSNSNDTGLYPVFGDDFRDKEPYTTVQINVPFCGSFEVPTTYFYKYGGVRVALMIDFVSGACTAYLMVNNDIVDSVSGSCAVDLPVTGLQSATLDGNIHSAAMAEKSAQTSGTLSMVAGAISIGAGIVTGNPLLAIGGATALISGATSLEKNQSQIDYDVQHMQLPLKQVGAASGAIAQCGDYRCKMIIKRPVMLDYDDEVYSKTIGYACLLNGSVSNFHGLTYGEIDLTNINCSESEKEMIKSAFASGVYLP